MIGEHLECGQGKDDIEASGITTLKVQDIVFNFGKFKLVEAQQVGKLKKIYLQIVPQFSNAHLFQNPGMLENNKAYPLPHVLAHIDGGI